MSVEAEVEIERQLLASGLGAAAASVGAIPTIDMSADDGVCARQMWEAAGETGFFTLVNHGVEQSAIDAVFGASERFFGQALEAKHAQSPFSAENNVGFEFKSQVRPSTRTADQKESLQVTARAGAMDGRWPEQPAGFEQATRELMVQAHALGSRVVALLEPLACPHLEPGTLRRSHTLWAPGGQCTLRLLHYPPIEKPDELPSNTWRAGPHTDWCSVTLLFQRHGEGGLECAANPRAPEHGGWLRVEPVAGGITINVGDMLSRWSNGRVLSNLHRVRMPTVAECSPPRSRFSCAFFMQADRDTVVVSEGHADITAAEYIVGRIKSNFAQLAPSSGS